MKYIKKYQTTAEALADEREKPWLIHINETDKCGLPLPELCFVDTTITINASNYQDFEVDEGYIMFAYFYDCKIKTSDKRIKTYHIINENGSVDETITEEGIYKGSYFDIKFYGIKIEEGKTIADYYGDYNISFSIYNCDCIPDEYSELIPTLCDASYIKINQSIKELGERSLGCFDNSHLPSIVYEGTIAEWNAITKYESSIICKGSSANITIQCKNGNTTFEAFGFCGAG